jgi:anti-sigma factor ChrR (cupin superfamily)
MAKNPKVRITWNGMGGELDSVTVKDDGEQSIANALIKLVQGNVVSPGDSFTVEEIER